MKIGHVDLGDRPLLLAPMEDVTDVAFRLLCRRFGADMVYTEFLSSDALIRQIAGTTRKLTIDPLERPVAIQIYGREVASMVEAARICEAAEPEILDLNFGCPVKRVAGKGAGSGMLRCPELMLEIVREIVRAVKIPVTVKTRLGWDNESKIIVRLAEELQDCGIQALTIHGRTRAQMYTGQADWTLIGEVKNNPRMHIPIIGNGDITTGAEALNAFETYGVDGVMVGRASIGQPWIFERMKHYLKTGQELPERDPSFYIDVLRQQVDSNIAKLDERRGILHSRRHIAASSVFKGIDHFKPIRIGMLRAATREELFDWISRAEELVLEHYHAHEAGGL
ncbi:tRNA dihydrouridine synthase DusB [Porphyromonas sp. COT-239 OH1446]|uniref:tRNA dihydrouridine synthase DusB n=1 Tax=Porphyromonas sp. COT-239 OH1446 TaxID=1515613 RepID=UPI00052D32E5|nr:tRNA dihydrouridine synthase DusB [Porphyromonas sp. COT-239 OH1446]KGN67953.1 TIM-barrel enzyme [Porphyromonas sp. COT-239 OH1446]